jgi:hypothetical protein
MDLKSVCLFVGYHDETAHGVCREINEVFAERTIDDPEVPTNRNSTFVADETVAIPAAVRYLNWQSLRMSWARRGAAVTGLGWASRPSRERGWVFTLSESFLWFICLAYTVKFRFVGMSGDSTVT